MKIGFIGLGKLGLPVALAADNKGHDVKGFDLSQHPYDYLRRKKIPYQEKDLQPLLNKHTVELVSMVEDMFDSDIIFVPVQTPHDPEYEGNKPMPKTRKDFDYTFLKNALRMLEGYEGVIAVISTCLPGTYEEQLKEVVPNSASYVYTPQFIAMGTVLEDYLHPEFNLIGVEDKAAADLLEKYYNTINNAPCVRTDITTAEGIKVSYNTWITAKTVIANAWGELSHKLSMNFDDMKQAWDYSTRRLWSIRYTDSGMSDGGGCHPRDNIAMSYIADKVGISHNIWEDLMSAREDFEAWHADFIEDFYKMSRMPVILLGRSFKPETNIETGSPAVLVSHLLTERKVPHTHVEDLPDTQEPHVIFIGTKHDRYKNLEFPDDSVVIDPFRYLNKVDNITYFPIGGKIK